MTEKDLFREIGNINEKYIVEAEETKRAVIWTPAFRRTLATAACLVVCFGLYLGVRQLDLGAQTESAPAQLENAMDMSQNMTMDSASNSGNAAGEDGSFWEEIWPMENAATNTESKSENAESEMIQQDTYEESTTMESATPEADVEVGADVGAVENVENKGDSVATQGVQETQKDNEQREKYFMVDLLPYPWLMSGQEELGSFLELCGNGEEATLELIRTLEDGTYERAYLSYDGKDSYVWTQWQAPDYGMSVEKATETEYGKLSVFEDMLEDGTTCYVVALGEADLSLQDLHSGKEGTLIVLQYVE